MTRPSPMQIFHFRPTDMVTTLVNLREVIKQFPQHVSLTFHVNGLIERIDLHEIPGPFLFYVWNLDNCLQSSAVLEPGDKASLTIHVTYESSGGLASVEDIRQISQSLAQSCTA